MTLSLAQALEQPTPPITANNAAASIPAGQLPQGKLERLPLSQLTFYDSETYGRNLDERRLNVLRASWNEQKCGCIYVSRRQYSLIGGPPILAVIDGHHRVIVAGEKGVDSLPALVWDGLSVIQEASLYAAFGSVLRQSPMQVFRARLAALDTMALNLNQIVQDAGYSFNLSGSSSNPFRLSNVAMLERFYRRLGGGHLFDVLTLVDRMFPGEEQRTRDPVIRAVSLIKRYFPMLDEERLIKHVHDAGFLYIMTQANGYAHTMRKPIYHGFGVELVEVYNKHGGRKLPDWKQTVPAKDFSSTGIAAIRAARVKEKGRPKKAQAKRYPHGTAGKRVIWTDVELAGRPD